MSEKQKKEESRRTSENPRGRNKKSREEIRREIREFITQQHRRSGSARGPS